MRIAIISMCALLTVYAGCGLVDELATANLSSAFSHSVTIDVTDDDPMSLTESFTVSSTTDYELNKYKDRIKSYTVKRISYQITDYVGVEGITMDCSIQFGTATMNLTDVDLHAFALAGAKIDMNFDQDQLEDVAEDLENGNDISGVIDGSVSDKPVTFTMKFIFEVEYEAGVIE